MAKPKRKVRMCSRTKQPNKSHGIKRRKSLTDIGLGYNSSDDIMKSKDVRASTPVGCGRMDDNEKIIMKKEGVMNDFGIHVCSGDRSSLNVSYNSLNYVPSAAISDKDKREEAIPRQPKKYSDSVENNEQERVGWKFDENTPNLTDVTTRREENEEKIRKMTSACRIILECIGENPDREGLLKTPSRWANALLFMTQGYFQSALSVTNGAVYSEDKHKEMVVLKDIHIHSLCEHHMLPFTGHVHVGYIPNGEILGLSKIARIAEVFSRRLQVQERLTSQIADAIVEAVDPLGVVVVLECSHFCMIMRGVKQSGAKTVTNAMRGCFQNKSMTCANFFNVINGVGFKMS